MGVIISLNSLEKNVGVSTVALTLAEKINFLSMKSVCVVECDYESPSYCHILEREANSIETIDQIMAYLIGKEPNALIGDIVRSNAKKFRQCDISVIFGSRHKKIFEPQQYNNLIKVLKEMYDVVILDFGNKELLDLVLEKSDSHLFISQSNYRFFRELKRNKLDFISKKTEIVLNNYDKKIAHVKREFLEEFGDRVIGTLPSSSDVNTTLVNGAINIDKGNYYNSITKIAKKVMKMCDIDVVVKNNLIKKISGNEEKREEDIRIKSFEELKLGDILIENNICSKEDIERALDIQNKKIIKMN